MTIVSSSIVTIGVLALLGACSPTFVTPVPAEPSAPTLTEHIFTACDKTELPVRAWLPSPDIDAVIIAVHGFNDYSNFIKDAAPIFNDQKIAVYAYDQRGFGATATRCRWSGIQLLADDLAAFIMLAAARHPGLPIYVLGDSMGGAVTIVTMARKDPPKVDGVILVAPAVWSRSEMPFYQRWALWLAARTIPWHKVTGESLDIKPSDNIEMLKALGNDPLVIKKTRIDVLYGLSNLMDTAYSSAELLTAKLLLLYGEKDEIIPREPVMHFYRRLPMRKHNLQQIQFYENGYHMLLRDLQADIVRKDILAWIKR